MTQNLNLKFKLFTCTTCDGHHGVFQYLSSSHVADNHERIWTGETLMSIMFIDGAAIGCHAERSETVVVERTTEGPTELAVAVESAL